MDYQAGELLKDGNNYYVQDKKRFLVYAAILPRDKKECFDFAYDMSYGEKGEHRNSRSGGTIHRTKGQIFINTFQGKMAEFALYRFLEDRQIDVNKPDTEKYGLGKWDSFDLDCQDKHFSVKSTKSYGNLLLLETKDWNRNGEYIPNLLEGTSRYDYTVLVRFKPDGESLMKQNHLLFQKDDEIPDNIKEILMEKINNQNWTYDFPGFIYNSELVKLIRNKCIIPKNAMLNGGTKMDAENYYFQTGNMHSMTEIYTRDVNEEVDERASLRLKRKCPDCGKVLILRKGRQWFWGCEGFVDKPRCEYRETLDNKRF